MSSIFNMNVAEKTTWKLLYFLLVAVLYATGLMIAFLPETNIYAKILNVFATMIIFYGATWLAAKLLFTIGGRIKTSNL